MDVIIILNMSTDSSSGDLAFDLDSKTGVMQVLQAVRQSNLPKAKQNGFRDLVFSYANSNSDKALRAILLEEITKASLVPISPLKKEQEKIAVPTQTFGFAGARPVPVFGVNKPSVNLPAAKITPTIPLTSVPPNTPVQNQPVTQKAVGTQPVKSADNSSLRTLKVETRSEEVKVSQKEAQKTGTPKFINNEVKKHKGPIVPLPEVTEPGFAVEMERIRTIKETINNKVGNPVNLVDIDKAVGSEYMMALLDAMKQISGGGNVASAMSRLEAAFLAASDVIENKNLKPIAKANSQTQNSNGASIAPKMLEMIKPVAQTNPAPLQPPKIEPKVPPISRPATATTPTHTPAPQIKVVPATGNETDAVSISSSRFNINPVSDAKPLRNINELPTSDMVNREDGDPLFSKEVDDGLEQLLSEWVLFNKSGLLGTGPKGRQHPLYQKVSNLPIPLLLSGRFEGATPEVRQSVSDYMNGWRYEQGIIYEENETFELYLRRVIRHILDWQKKKRTA